MGVYTLLAGVEVKLASTLRTSVLEKPGQQGGSVPVGTDLRKSDKVINVNVATPCETLAEPKTCGCNQFIPIAERRKLVSGESLRADALKEGCGIRELAEMSHDREAGEDVHVGLSERDLQDNLRAAA